MPLYEVVLEQEYNGKPCVNRWNYLGGGTPTAVQPSFALLTAMGFLAASTTFVDTTVAGRIQRMQNTAVRFVQCTARAVFVDDDFYGNGFLSGTFGTNATAGDAMANYEAFGFRSSRVKQSIGRGYKRFVGLTEGMVGAYGEFTSGVQGGMEQVADEMSNIVTYDDEGNTLTFSPCIAQKLKYTTPSGKDAYKYYPTEVAQAPHLAIGINWEIYDDSRTQNSRKP